MHSEQRSMRRFLVTRCLPAVALCGAMQPSWSQTAPAVTSDSALDEIVVTATRRSAALIETECSSVARPPMGPPPFPGDRPQR